MICDDDYNDEGKFYFINMTEHQDIINNQSNLFIRTLGFFFFFILIDVEVAKFVGVLGGGDDVHELAQLVLLQELLGEVFEVTLAEMDVSNHGNLAAVTLDFDGLAELTGFTVDLEFVMQKVFLEKKREREKEDGNWSGLRSFYHDI